VKEEDSETFTRALNDAMDRMEESQTIYSSEIREEETEEPENAPEIPDAGHGLADSGKESVRPKGGGALSAAC
jgi:hypothetical protein